MFSNLHQILLFLLLSHCHAYDLLTGLLRQVDDCFPFVNAEDCNTPIYEAYTTEKEQIGDNPPYTFFHLFTYKNQDKSEPLHRCGGQLPEKTDFDKTVDTIFVAHGYIDGPCRTAWQREIRDQLFIKGKYNVILIDWTWGNTPDPAGAANNALVAGEQAAFVIHNIMDRYEMDGSRFHLIGHSYGSYLVGHAALTVRLNNEANLLRRVTYLDPAVAPADEEEIRNGKLSYKNGKFVDVIHSGGGICFPFHFGLIVPVGHVDFYPNGGSVQLSCIEYTISTALRLDFYYSLVSLIPPICFHLQSIQFFKVSINNPNQFIGVQCESYEDFLSGACSQCCRDNSDDCLVAGMDSEKYYNHKDEPREIRKYYFDTSVVCPYNETGLINKGCEDKGSTTPRLF